MFRSLVNWMLMCLGFDVRGIFRFHDGRRWRYIDPWSATRELFSATNGFDYDTSLEELKKPDSASQLGAIAVIAETVRIVFKVPGFEAGGLSEQECVDLLMQFREYLGDVKKNGSLWQISPAAMAPVKPVPQFRAKPDSDSGLTSIDSISVEPGSSVKAS